MELRVLKDQADENPQERGTGGEAAENSGDLQRVPFEYSAEYLKAHVCNKTTSGWGKNYLKA